MNLPRALTPITAFDRVHLGLQPRPLSVPPAFANEDLC